MFYSKYMSYCFIYYNSEGEVVIYEYWAVNQPGYI